MTIEILNPTHEDNAEMFTLAPRVSSLAGKTVGIVSNGKQGTHIFFDVLEEKLRDEYAVGDVVRVTKANYSAPAQAAIMQQAIEWDALISGIGD